MASYKFSGQVISEVGKEHIRSLYAIICQQYQTNPFKSDLDNIFNIALLNPDYFTPIQLPTPDPENYLKKWVKSYFDAVNRLPSTCSARPKQTCTDLALRVIVKASQDFSDDEVTSAEQHHNLYMSAENVQGKLLEEYIALNTREYGILWCAGKVLHSIDFCNSSGQFLLQVKNKYNTENSSSSAIRKGTLIQKWYRLGVKTEDKKLIPVYKWEKLNDLINSYKSSGDKLPPCKLSESGYCSFLEKVSRENPSLITPD